MQLDRFPWNAAQHPCTRRCNDFFVAPEKWLPIPANPNVRVMERLSGRCSSFEYFSPSDSRFHFDGIKTEGTWEDNVEELCFSLKIMVIYYNNKLTWGLFSSVMNELFSELWKDEFITVDINVLRYSTNQRFKKAEISILKQSIGANHAEYLAPEIPNTR